MHCGEARSITERQFSCRRPARALEGSDEVQGHRVKAARSGSRAEAADAMRERLQISSKLNAAGNAQFLHPRALKPTDLGPLRGAPFLATEFLGW